MEIRPVCIQLFIYLLLGLFFLASCVSSSRYQSLQSNNEQLQIQLDSLRILNRELAYERQILEETEERLRKTENALIQFYVKYEEQIPEEGIYAKEILPGTDELYQEISKLKSENKILRIKLDSTITESNKLAEAADLAVKNAKDKKDNSSKDLKAETERLKSSLDDLQEQLAQKDKKIGAQESQINSLNADMLSLKEKYSREQKAKSDIKAEQESSFHVQLQSKENELEQLRGQNDLLVQKLEYINRLHSDKKDEYDQLLSAQKKTSSDLELERKSIASLNSVIDLKNSELQDLQLRIKNLELELVNLKNESNERSIELNKLQVKRQPAKDELNELQTENKELKKDLSALSARLESKDHQLDDLTLKLSKYKDTDKGKNEIVEVRDSLKQIRSLSEKNNTVIKELNNNLTISQSELTIQKMLNDSLKEVVFSHQGREQFLQNQIRDYADEIEILKNEKQWHSKPETKDNRMITSKVSEPDDHSKSEQKAVISAQLLKILESCKRQYANKSIEHVQVNDKVHLYFPQSILFEVNSFALSQNGSNLISELSKIIRPYKKLKINLTAFGEIDPSGNKTMDNLIRNASTVYKLMGALGQNPASMKIGAKLKSEIFDQIKTREGLEITMYEE